MVTVWPVPREACTHRGNNSSAFPKDRLTSWGKHTIERTMTLSPVNWQALTNLAGDGSILNVRDSLMTGAEQFYRVKAQ